jgi:hypothetical protein
MRTHSANRSQRIPIPPSIYRRAETAGISLNRLARESGVASHKLHGNRATTSADIGALESALDRLISGDKVAA